VYGVSTLGKLVKKEETSMRVNYATVYKMHFQFSPEKGKKYTAVCRTYKTDLLENEQQKKLLYNPNNPKKVLLNDLLPRSIKGITGRMA
jgi:hypothetical protein